jgi:hypothetical protein
MFHNFTKMETPEKDNTRAEALSLIRYFLHNGHHRILKANMEQIGYETPSETRCYEILFDRSWNTRRNGSKELAILGECNDLNTHPILK